MNREEKKSPLPSAAPEAQTVPRPPQGGGGLLAGIDWLSESVGKMAGLLIVVLALIVSYDVVKRYFFGQPTVWAQEMSAMLFGTFIILGGAYTAKENKHVNMDIFYSRFSPRGRAVLDIITFFILTIPFLGILLWKGGEGAWRSLANLEHDSTQWGPPLYPFRIMLPLGALLFLLQAMVKLIRDFQVIGSTGRKG
jgi:TRAP-type mannitol/chloroaromatic compound transport system permease small subunit